MTKEVFLAKHTLWLPKWWVVMILVVACFCLLLSGFKNMANYLAISEPSYGEYLIVDGWLNTEALDQALTIFGTNKQYKYLVTIGGPDTRSFNNLTRVSHAEQSAKYLLSKGLEKHRLFVLTTPPSAQTRTYHSAVYFREWLIENDLRNITFDVFTDSVHARRTLYLYKLAFRSNIKTGVYAAKSSNYDTETWWRSSNGAKSTLTEFIGLIWTVFFFDPGEYGSHQEKWGMKKP